MLSLLITQPVTSISCSSFHFLNSLFSKLQILNKEVSNIRLSNKYRRWQLTSYRIYKYKKARKWNHRTSDEFHVPVNVMWHVRNRDMLRLNSEIFTIFDPGEWHLILKSSDYRAWKIIWNDAKLGPFSWELKSSF